jgi:glycosyltransferase involved in cell wall biosynthesis
MPDLKDARRAYTVWKEAGWSGLRRKLVKRLFQPGMWAGYQQEASEFAAWFDFSEADLLASRQIQEANAGPLDIRSITWLLPEFQHAYYGGVYTLLRFASTLKDRKGIAHQFALLGTMDPDEAGEKIARSFPSLSREPVWSFLRYEEAAGFPAADAVVSTLWGTAFFALRMNQFRRKFYFVQDFEPLFYPAGTVSALAEATYRFGFYGIANTPSLQAIYEGYGGRAACFTPCVDTEIFYPSPYHTKGEPYTVFFYGRPGHPRNGFELGAQALRILKKRLGDRVRILAAGDRWNPKDFDLQGVVENLGLLDYQKTAEVYRASHAGLAMMFTRHPSYLPLEFMASGCLVVTNKNPATAWLLKDEENCLLSQASATCLADTLQRGLMDEPLRERVTRSAARQIREQFSDWGQQIEKIYAFMCNPEAR